MPPSPLDPRHSPDRPDDAPPQRPTEEELLKCLRAWLPKVEVYLKLRFPEYAVLDALEKAEAVGLSAICGDLHDKMKPEEMTSACRQAWLRKVAQNAALTVLRRKQPVPFCDESMLPSASTSAFDTREQELVLKAVEKLPQDDQELIAAVYDRGMSRRQYAALMNIGEATVRRRHDNAICRLRDEFLRLSNES